MTNFTDRFGAAVTDNGDGTWMRGGVTIRGDRDQAVVVFDAMAPDGWTPPPAPPPTTIAPLDFINRFTPAEQQVILTAAQTNWTIQLWLSKEVAAEVVDTATPLFVTGMAALVSAGLVTPDRAAAIADLAVASP